MDILRSSDSGCVFAVSCQEREMLLDALKAFVMANKSSIDVATQARDLYNMIAAARRGSA